jgi:hypothetical protein
MNLKPGDIIFFNNEGKAGKWVKRFNKLKFGEEGWTHCGIITKVEDESIEVHEALSKGFTQNNYQKKEIIDRFWYGDIHFKRPTKRLTRVREHAQEYIGTKYGWIDIFAIIISLLIGKWSIKVTGAKRLICSEAVARVLYDASKKKINFEEEYNKSYDLITPHEIFMSRQLNEVI